MHNDHITDANGIVTFPTPQCVSQSQSQSLHDQCNLRQLTQQTNKQTQQSNKQCIVCWMNISGWGSVSICCFCFAVHPHMRIPLSQPQLSLFYQVTKCDNKFSITAKYLVLEYQCNCEQNHTRQLLPNDPMSLDTLLSMQTFDIDQMFSWPFSHSRGKLFSQETM